MPLSVTAWYQCVLTVIPSTSPQASNASRSSTGPSTPSLAKKALLRHVPPEELVSWRLPVTNSQSFHTLPAGIDLGLVRATMLHELDSMPCECAALMTHPALSNTLGNVMLRHPWQWETWLPPAGAHFLGTNARYRLWHLAASLWEAWELSKSHVHDLHDRFHLQPLQSPSYGLANAFRCVQIYNNSGAAEALHLSVEVAQHARSFLGQHNIVGGVFDKNLKRQYAVCRVLHEKRIAFDNVFVDRFRIYRFADTWRHANLTALYATV